MIQLQGHNNQIMVVVGHLWGMSGLGSDCSPECVWIIIGWCINVIIIQSLSLLSSSSPSPSSSPSSLSYHHYHCPYQHHHQTPYRAEVLACWILVRWTHRAAMHFTHTWWFELEILYYFFSHLWLELEIIWYFFTFLNSTLNQIIVITFTILQNDHTQLVVFNTLVF